MRHFCFLAASSPPFFKHCDLHILLFPFPNYHPSLSALHCHPPPVCRNSLFPGLFPASCFGACILFPTPQPVGCGLGFSGLTISNSVIYGLHCLFLLLSFFPPFLPSTPSHPAEQRWQGWRRIVSDCWLCVPAYVSPPSPLLGKLRYTSLILRVVTLSKWGCSPFKRRYCVQLQPVERHQIIPTTTSNT